MRILVTGASGFIGSHLIHRLRMNHEVTVLTRDPDRVRVEKIEVITADLTRPIDPRDWPARLDAIIHLAQASVPFPESAEELFVVNTVSTQRLLDYARSAGARRFILASSGDVYGNTGLSRETDPANPQSFYATTKHSSELLAMSYSEYVEPCVLRLFQPFGPGQSRRLIPRLAERIEQGEPVLLNKGDRPLVSPLYIDDVVAAFEKALTVTYTGVINLAGDRALSIRQLADEIGNVVGRTPLFEYSEHEAGDLAGDNARMKEVLGNWPLIRLADGLARTFGDEQR